MLPVVHETGGPPSSRRRRRATAVPLVVAALTVSEEAEINARNTGAGRISRLTSTATMMTMALTVLLVLVPAAFPEKIPIVMRMRRNRVSRRKDEEGCGMRDGVWVLRKGIRAETRRDPLTSRRNRFNEVPPLSVKTSYGGAKRHKSQRDISFYDTPSTYGTYSTYYEL
ncbi:hypothetical protein ALC62_00286 [Cyphomyrmex costatus]|uniref:Uncharacterized protein n=1 Tax=Cyphomyrmex costatus TaxID=456900 RepID=A0A195D6W8_9HYME|nr:hypothetical protein ALC62_00286 [Cyphomyrmex costatus]